MTKNERNLLLAGGVIAVGLITFYATRSPGGQLPSPGPGPGPGPTPPLDPSMEKALEIIRAIEAALPPDQAATALDAAAAQAQAANPQVAQILRDEAARLRRGGLPIPPPPGPPPPSGGATVDQDFERLMALDPTRATDADLAEMDAVASILVSSGAPDALAKAGALTAKSNAIRLARRR